MAKTDERRPSPDALLDLAVREGRGRLKIFLGAAPGVGKTFAMLQGARQSKAEGRDVVIGIVETHGRKDTAGLLEGLEVLPRLALSHRGHEISEFDIDGALKRRPSLIVVDELAHSNGPGMRHPKRHQDVQELLTAGIDVWTALNIQHIESLADVVASITGVRVREVVPDTVIENADDVVLVDITPDELIQRLRDGKVYLPENARRAADNFFQPGNLTALRDLALRRTAQRVDDQMTDFLRQKAIEGPWPSAERILVCVSGGTTSDATVRAAARLAAALNAPWFALHLESLSTHSGDERRLKADEALALARRLGAEVLRAAVGDPVAEVMKVARRENITQIVVGRSRRNRLLNWGRRSVADRLVQAAHGIAVHILTEEGKPPRQLPLLPRIPFAGIVMAFATVATATLIGSLLSRELKLPNLSMIYLAAVLFCAMGFGTWSAVAAAFLSFVAYNFFFIEPTLTLTVASPHELLALVIFLLVAVLTGSLAGRVREQSLAALSRVRQVETLLDVSRKLSSTVRIDDTLWVLATQAAAAVAGEAIVLLKSGGELTIAAAMPPEDNLSTADWAAACWSVERGEVAGWHSDTMPSAHFQFQPLRTPHGVVGVVGIRPKSGQMDSGNARLLAAIIEQSALAVERALLSDEAAEAKSSAESERLRSALLSSLSHDLRTPLSSILGAVTTLRSLGTNLKARDRSDLLMSIEEEASRLSRFVSNLLDMTRLEGGSLKVSQEPIDAADVAAAVLRRARQSWPARTFLLDAADVSPMLGDAALLDLLIFNLLENAHKYSPVERPVVLEVKSPAPGVVTIGVVDEGMGIAEGDLDRVFEKFFRVETGDGRPPGTGLGLAICRAIATAMGGKIRAESPVRNGRGSRFVAEFPTVAK